MLKIGSPIKRKVREMKVLLIKFGYKLDPENGNFGVVTDAAVKDFQSKHGLEVDGIVGPLTMAELEKGPTPPPPLEPVPPGVMPPWVAYLLSRLGWTEYDHDKEIAKDWPKVGLDYKTVIGTSYAWCGLAAYMSLYVNGLRGPKGAAASRNWRQGWGEVCGYISGAFLPIRHANGSGHICVFLYWVDEAKKLAACLGGNQSNGYRISTFNLSGNKAGKDEVIGGPRWPLSYPQTGYVYPKGQADAGGSTR